MPDELENSLEEPSHSVNGLIRVEDHLGRLLFMYNPQTRKIEYIPIRAGKFQGARRIKFFIDTDKLRSVGARNVISDNPVTTFVVEEFENA